MAEVRPHFSADGTRSGRLIADAYGTGRLARVRKGVRRTASWLGGLQTAPYHAESFFVMPGRCFRMMSSDGKAGPIHCPDPPVWLGRFRATDGRWHTVDACDGHRGPQQGALLIQPHQDPG